MKTFARLIKKRWQTNSPIKTYYSYKRDIEKRVLLNILNAIKLARIQLKVAVSLKSVSANMFRLIWAQ